MTVTIRDPIEGSYEAEVDSSKRLQIAGAITTALPAGDNNIGKVRLYDEIVNRENRINPGNGALAVDVTQRIIGPQFVGSTLDTEFWTLANDGTSSAAALSNGVVSLTSGTANSGSGSLVSFANARFLFVNPNEFRMLSRVTDTTVADCTRRWGAINISAGTPLTLDNGFYFSLNGAGELSVNHKHTGSAATSVASGSFNGNVDSYTMDINAHAYEILYFEACVWFFIDGIFIHKFTPTTAKLTDNFTLAIGAESVNIASGTTSGVLEVFASSILRIGSETTAPHYKNISANATTTLKRSAGRLHRVVINKFNSSNTLAIYDNTAGTGATIATITLTVETTLEFGIEFHTGLTVVTSGGTAGDITVVYD